MFPKNRTSRADGFVAWHQQHQFVARAQFTVSHANIRSHRHTDSGTFFICRLFRVAGELVILKIAKVASGQLKLYLSINSMQNV